jgi:sec-independent protein translocase protein TatC
MPDPLQQEDELAGTEQPFVQHLLELRDRLLRALYGVGAVLVLILFYPGPLKLYDWLAKPMVAALPDNAHMIAVGVVTPFLVPIKVTVLMSMAIALPWILYQIWGFIAPGLYRHEKKLILPLIATSTLLFYVGVAFCYFFVFGQAFPAIQKMTPTSVVVSPDIEAYLDFVITMFIAFGLAFEVPIAVVILAYLKVVTIEQLKQFRSYFLVGAAAVAGLVTPPDPVSMIALLVPMYLLYEAGIWSAKFLVQKRQFEEPPKAPPSA